MEFFSFKELPCAINKPLMDIEVTENDTISMSIILSKSRLVKWLKGESPISFEDGRFASAVTDNGLEHTLTVSRVLVEDSAIFTAEIDDKEYGLKFSSCSMLVKGTFNGKFTEYCQLLYIVIIILNFFYIFYQFFPWIILTPFAFF